MSKKNKKQYYEEEEDDQLDYESIDDEQYLNLLQNNETKSHKYDIELGNKYQGRKQEIVEDESINSDELSDYHVDKQTKKETKKVTKKQQQLELVQLQEEDLEVVEKQEQNLQELQEISAQIKEQQQIWSSLVDIRQQMQKSLSLVKKLPLKFTQNSNNRNELMHHLQNNIMNLYKLSDSLYPTDNTLSTFHQYEPFKEYFEKQQKFVEEDIVKWTSKSAMLMNKSMNFLLMTPIGQTQKVLQQKEKLLQKAHLKRAVFRILGETAEDLNEISNANIYDDTDFYLELMKESLNTHEESQETEQFILKRQLQREERQGKVVDRRASKCRKIRYEPHQVSMYLNNQKLINFMSHTEEPQSMYSRDDILNNIFGKSKKKVLLEKFDVTLI